MERIFNNIYILGIGAVGGLIAGTLTEKFPGKVFSIDTDKEHSDAISSQGLKYDLKRNANYESFNSGLEMISYQEFSPRQNDLVIIALKQYSMPEVLPRLNLIQCPLIFMQNGYNPSYEKIKNKKIQGVIGFAASFIEPGHIRQTTPGEIYIGSQNVASSRIELLSQELSTEKLKFKPKQDIRGCFWSKLIFNAAMNPVTSLIGRGYEKVFADSDARELASEVYLESYNIARKHCRNMPNSMGFSPDRIAQFLRFPFIKKGLFFASKKFRDVESSMIQDVKRGRKTEIDYINGFLVQKAREKGIDARINNSLVELIHRIERKEISPSLNNTHFINLHKTL